MIKEIIEKYLLSDILFKFSFGIPEHKNYIIKLLSVLLDMPESKFKNIVITNSVKLTPDTIKNRKFETDIVIEAPNLDFIINLEVQPIYDKVARSKNNAYANGLAYKQFKSGKHGNKNIKKIIQINLVKKFVGVENLEGKFSLCDLKLKKYLNDEQIEIRIINVEKFRTLLYNENIKERDLLLSLLSVDTKEELEITKRKAKKYPIIRS